MTLHELLSRRGKEILGRAATSAGSSPFPLLYKLIDVQDRLSVQVHPDDAYAAAHEPGELGKTEAWYILHAEPRARAYRGFKPGVKRETVVEGLKSGGFREEWLNGFEVRAGDIVFIPAGMIHSAGGGVLLAEIQQNSDVTYRVFDWNRLGLDGKPRELHVEKSLDVIRFEDPGPSKMVAARLPGFPYRRDRLVACDKFVFDLLRFTRPIVCQQSGEVFEILCLVKGSTVLHFAEGPKGALALKKGESVLIPACVTRYDLRPTEECALLSAVPVT
jgi:mannose-6-phosphate isomerase